MLEHSGARLVFCEDAEQAAKIEQIRDRCPALEHVVLFDGATPTARSRSTSCASAGAEVPPDAVQRAAGGRRPRRPRDARLHLGHDRAAEGLHAHATRTSSRRRGCTSSSCSINETHSLYQFLPLAHVLARVAQAVVHQRRARGSSSGAATRAEIVDELAETRADALPGGPADLREDPRRGPRARRRTARRLQRALFDWALGCGARRARGRGARARCPVCVDDAPVPARRSARAVARSAACSGPNLQLALVGAAPVARELLEFFDACGVLVLEGYGLTESCAAATLNTPHAVRFGTVGRPLPGTEVAIADDGEILIRGPHVFRGYYKDDAGHRPRR